MQQLSKLHCGCFFNPFQKRGPKNVLRQSHSLSLPGHQGIETDSLVGNVQTGDPTGDMGCLGFPFMGKWKSGKLEWSCSRKPLRLSTADVLSNELYREFFCCLLTETSLVELKEVGITSPWKEKNAGSSAQYKKKKVVSQCFYHCLLTQKAELSIEWKTPG